MEILGKSNTTAPAVKGENTDSGAGVYGISQEGAGLRGETHSTKIAAVMGITLNPESLAAAVYGEQKGKGPGMMGTSQEGTGIVGISKGGVGVHGETNATMQSAVLGIAMNPESLATAVYGENKGKGAGVGGVSQEGTGVYGESKGKGAGVTGINQEGVGVYGESKSATDSAIAGIQLTKVAT